MKTPSTQAAAAALILAGLTQATNPCVEGSLGCVGIETAAQKISAFDDSDFVFALGSPELDDFDDSGAKVRPATVTQFPALIGEGIAMNLINLDACAIMLPHIHPRASEIIYVVEGDLRSAFVKENGGGGGAVVNDLTKGDVTFYPQGLIHYQQNLGCYPVSVVGALSSEDPGSVTVLTRFFDLPSEAIEAALNVAESDVDALVAGLPMAPIEARRECLRLCGLTDDDGGKRNLRSG